jgi:hypothetical protein
MSNINIRIDAITLTKLLSKICNENITSALTIYAFICNDYNSIRATTVGASVSGDDKRGLRCAVEVLFKVFRYSSYIYTAVKSRLPLYSFASSFRNQHFPLDPQFIYFIYLNQFIGPCPSGKSANGTQSPMRGTPPLQTVNIS